MQAFPGEEMCLPSTSGPHPEVLSFPHPRVGSQTCRVAAGHVLVGNGR
jgi:hypothetical protein